MNRYTTVESFIWHDEKFRALPEDARTVFLYLLTCPHGNMCGIFYLPDLYAASDLQWDVERYRKAIDTLCDTLLIAKDRDIIWIKNYLKHNPIKGPKQITGAVNRLMTLPDTKLIGPFMKNLEKHLLEDDVKLFKELYTKPYEYPSDTLSDTLCDTPSIADTDPDTDTDTDTVSSSSSDHLAHNRADDDDDDVPMSEVVKKFSELWGPPNSTHLDMINSYLNDRLTTWHILEALNRAAEANATHPNYIKAILQGWVKNKAYTPDAVRELDKVHERRQSASNRRAQSNAAEPRKTRYDPDEYREILREAGMLKEVEPVEAGTG